MKSFPALFLHRLALFAGNGFREHFQIQIQTNLINESGLLRTQHIPGSPDCQIPHGDFVSGSQLCEFPDGPQALGCLFCQLLVRLNHEITVGNPVPASHPAPDLIQLRQTEVIRVFNDHRVGVFNIQTCLDDGGANENFVFS